MAKLPWAKLSPRIENGVIYWYEGDTFRLHLHLELWDTEGLPVEPREEDTAELCFYNKSMDPVMTLQFTSEQVRSGILTLPMDEAATALFPAGRYTYDLRLLGQERKTLIRGGIVEVE